MPMLTWMASELRAAGLSVREIPGWQTRGHGAMGDIAGVLAHHTAGPAKGLLPSENVLVNGRPGLAGPLCNLALDRAGTWVVVAAGQGYHAGTGSAPFCPAGQGNSRLIGVEAESTGTTAPNGDWTAAQRESYPRGVAALLRHLGLPASRVIGHKEWAPSRKIDPAFWDMSSFRGDTARWITPGGPVADRVLKLTEPWMRGNDIGEAQRLLGIHDDDVFGPDTDRAVHAFQEARGLVVDGEVGPVTWRALRAAATPAPHPSPSPAPSGGASMAETLTEQRIAAILKELTGSDQPGSYPGFRTWGGGTDEDLTAMAYLQRSNVEVRQAWLAVQRTETALRSEVAGLAKQVGELVAEVRALRTGGPAPTGGGLAQVYEFTGTATPKPSA